MYISRAAIASFVANLIMKNNENLIIKIILLDNIFDLYRVVLVIWKVYTVPIDLQSITLSALSIYLSAKYLE